MTRPALRICVDCGARHREPLYRCRPCQRTRDHVRNTSREYRHAAWQRLSRAQRAAVGFCVRCGRTDDLTLDHETGQVECRSCNSSHRREPLDGRQ